MKIILQSLKLENFKGIKEFNFIPGGNNADVFGDNRTGKTTLKDAFIWLLFDKNSFDEKAFGIKTISCPEADHSVTGVFVADGQELILKKTYAEKWVKQRGSEERTLQGHETSYWINEVPSKKNEYDSKIKSLIDESIFKAITDVYFFNNMKWQERRNVLLTIVGDVSDETVIESDKDLAPLLKAKEKGHSIDDYVKIVKEKKRSINEEIKKLPTRIDEAEKSKPEQPELTLEELQANAVSVKEALAKSSSEVGKVDVTLEQFRQQTKELLESKTQLQKAMDRIAVDFRNGKYAAENERSDKERELRNSVKRKREDIELTEESITIKESRKASLLSEHKSLPTQFDKSSAVCPTCQREYDSSKVSELEANFVADVNKRAGKIKAEFDKVKQEIIDLTAAVAQKKIELTEREAALEDFLKTPVDIPTEPNFDVEPIIELKEKITKLEQSIEAFSNGQREAEDTSLVDTLTEQLELINKDIQKWETIKTLSERIEQLKSEEKELAKQYAQYEKAEFLTEKFIKAKVGMLEEKINSTFSMIEFKLFDTQVNGAVVECCEATVNGVPYQDINSEAKINAGLDIINKLTDYYGVEAPIFIDNAESVTRYIHTNSQLIRLYVSESDKSLRVEVR